MTYTTLDGRVLDLGGLTEVEQQHLDRCIEAYRQGMDWDQFMRLVDTPENPLVRTVGRGWVTREVAVRPMYQAIRDMADRLAIQQGYMAPSEGIDPDSDPFADEWIPAREAAERKGVSLVALHKAIDRGDIIARPATPGGGRIVVSARSLEKWKVDRARQQAGRARARTR
ncbi:hypothetical protein Tmar_0064 [Thermaerobacter marianensis DSM 12885]|uniref:Helix-turn-helix domain-containing protein n=1 Tax=Thermaerobacter marianensis (strain ATCC 700841 / DSM 12885 / JCM 10246 / 7p75a) TaxID=644966 RepID=E6SKK2_THEM7|nr:hypothetical protein [Thermaerobacter marianensis]ADU50189.1 hypothetical protein Tmar_0064 [Thermaerobacter marianensis DSM 12885]